MNVSPSHKRSREVRYQNQQGETDRNDKEIITNDVFYIAEP